MFFYASMHPSRRKTAPHFPFPLPLVSRDIYPEDFHGFSLPFSYLPGMGVCAFRGQLMWDVDDYYPSLPGDNVLTGPVYT